MRTLQTSAITSALCTAVLLLSAPAHASLIGDTVEACVAGPFPLVDSQAPTTCPDGNLFGASPTTAVVGAGVEFISTADPSKHIELDIDDSSFTVSIFNDSDSINFQINGFELLLSDLDWVGQAGHITGLALLGGNTLPDPIVMDFGPHSITIEFPTFFMSVDESFSAEFRIRAEHLVPEPAAISLLALGLLGLGASRRKRALSC